MRNVAHLKKGLKIQTLVHLICFETDLVLIYLLKKSVMIPVKYDDDGNIEEVANAYNPFMRGVMEFDDYNYTHHNPYVLVEDPKFADLASEKEELKEPV